MVTELSLLGCTPERSLSAKPTEIHDRILTVDGHIDWPIRQFLNPEFNPSIRNEPGLADSGQWDLVRMEEGGLDAVFMLLTMGLTIMQFILPILIFSSLLFPGLQNQEFLGLFGQEYQMRYDQCLEQSSQEQEEITRLRVALSATKVKLKDVDIFRESLEQREDALKIREENLQQREDDLDLKAQLLEQKIFDFTKQVEEVARNGGKVEQIITNNETLANRAQSLASKLDAERQLAREDLKNERSFFDKRIEEERGINSKLQQKIDRDSHFILIVEVVFLLVIFAIVIAISLLYAKWFSGKMAPTQSPIIEIDRQREELDTEQSAAALISSNSDQE